MSQRTLKLQRSCRPEELLVSTSHASPPGVGGTRPTTALPQNFILGAQDAGASAGSAEADVMNPIF